MTFDEVGTPGRLSDEPSPATNIPVVHTLLIQNWPNSVSCFPLDR